MQELVLLLAAAGLPAEQDEHAQQGTDQEEDETFALTHAQTSAEETTARRSLRPRLWR
jgi:hypothetical protein